MGAHSYRALLLCSVHPGNKYELTRTNSSLSSPPQGYHSIFGIEHCYCAVCIQATSTNSQGPIPVLVVHPKVTTPYLVKRCKLNYLKIVLSNADAILPRFIIFTKKMENAVLQSDNTIFYELYCKNIVGEILFETDYSLLYYSFFFFFFFFFFYLFCNFISD